MARRKTNYRRDIEVTARQMILVHRADTLIALILRTILKNIKVMHAGILLYDKKRDEYVVRVSRGDSGLKIPKGFVKVKKDNPLIRYFTDKKINLPKDSIAWSRLIYFLKSPKVKKDKTARRLLEDLKFNLSLYRAKICIPGFFRDNLIGVLFLGEKKNKRHFTRDEIGFLSVLASDAVMAIENAWLIEDLNRQVTINKRLFLQTVSALASSIEAKDRYTMGHTERVLELCLDTAEGLKKKVVINDWNKFIGDLKIAALLHDIGKIGIPESILHKRSPLDPKERSIIEDHPTIGANILKHIEEFKEVILGVKHHHERYDGKGYPSQLKGKQIPLIAAIISLADAFDAMISERPYRRAFSPKEAVAEIKNNRGTQFSPLVTDAFLKLYKG